MSDENKKPASVLDWAKVQTLSGWTLELRAELMERMNGEHAVVKGGGKVEYMHETTDAEGNAVSVTYTLKR